MAEGFLNQLAGDRFNVFSAGTEPKTEVHPIARQVMNEVGVDISSQHPKRLEEFLGRMAVRHLIIVCSGADENCPRIFPGLGERHYWPFNDPATFEGSPEETLDEFRRVRDEIRERIDEWLSAVPIRE